MFKCTGRFLCIFFNNFIFNCSTIPNIKIVVVFKLKVHKSISEKKTICLCNEMNETIKSCAKYLMNINSLKKLVVF